MGLSADQIRRIAILARIDLTPSEETIFGRQLAQVVEYIDQLKSLEGPAEAHGEELEQRQAADVVEPVGDTEWMLSNAPQRLDRFVLVPQIKGPDRG